MQALVDTDYLKMPDIGQSQLLIIDVVISAEGDKNTGSIIGHLQFMVKVSINSQFFAEMEHLDCTLLLVMTSVLSIVSTPVSDSKKKRQPDSAKLSNFKGRTPAKGITAS